MKVFDYEDVQLIPRKELVPMKGSILNTLKEMKEDLQSSISYAGGRKLSNLKKVGYVLLKNTEGV